MPHVTHNNTYTQNLLSRPALWATTRIWAGSVRGPVTFTPIAKRAAVKLFHQARRWERETRPKGRHNGKLSRVALLTLHALIFDFLNFRTGRLDPSYAEIAHKAGICVRSVANAIKRLTVAGVINKIRRCYADQDEHGRFRLSQDSNAYGLNPLSSWKGLKAPPSPPLPHRDTCGFPADEIDAMRYEEIKLAAQGQLSLSDPLDTALANLWRTREELQKKRDRGGAL